MKIDHRKFFKTTAFVLRMIGYTTIIMAFKNRNDITAIFGLLILLFSEQLYFRMIILMIAEANKKSLDFYCDNVEKFVSTNKGVEEILQNLYETIKILAKAKGVKFNE